MPATYRVVVETETRAAPLPRGASTRAGGRRRATGRHRPPPTRNLPLSQPQPARWPRPSRAPAATRAACSPTTSTTRSAVPTPPPARDSGPEAAAGFHTQRCTRLKIDFQNDTLSVGKTIGAGPPRTRDVRRRPRRQSPLSSPGWPPTSLPLRRPHRSPPWLRLVATSSTPNPACPRPLGIMPADGHDPGLLVPRNSCSSSGLLTVRIDLRSFGYGRLQRGARKRAW